MRRAAPTLVVLLLVTFALTQAPINPYSQGGGFNGQGWTWDAADSRWEMNFPGIGRPTSIITGMFLARRFNRASFIGDIVRSQGNCAEQNPTATLPALVKCTVSGAGSFAFFFGSEHLWRVGNYLRQTSKVAIGSTGTGCYGWGLNDNDVYTTCEFGGNYALFHFDASVDTNWQCKTRDNATTTTTDSNVAADTNLHVFDIVEVPGTGWDFYIDGAKVCTNTTHLPATGSIVFVVFAERSSGSSITHFFQFIRTQMRMKP